MTSKAEANSDRLDVPLVSAIDDNTDGVVNPNGDAAGPGADDSKEPRFVAAGSRRYFITFLLFCGLTLVYMMRVDLSIAILAMDPQYRWDHLPTDPKGFVLSSFYVGYILGQIPGGMIATKWGGNIVFGVGVLATGVFTMLLPLATCGSLTCPAFIDAPGFQGGGAATCNATGGNLLAEYVLTNKTETDCYTACLSTCFVHGDPADVCLAKEDGSSNACTTNCSTTDYCDFFFYGTRGDGGDASGFFAATQDPAVNTCLLFHECDAAAPGPAPANVTGGTHELQTTSYLPAVYVLRILMGLFESVTYPSYYALLSKWAPASERSFMVGAASGGAYFGTAVAFPVCSVLVASSLPVIGRWPGVFYLFGALTLVWAVAWFAIVRKDPEGDAAVSNAELEWITNTRTDDHDEHGGAPAAAATAADDGGEGAKKTLLARCTGSIWFRMLTCPASLSLYAVHFAANWLNYTLLSFLPTYFSGHLNFDISASGGLEVLPYVALWVVSTGGGAAMDSFIRRGCMTRLTARKLSQVLATVLPSVLLVSMGFTSNVALCVVLMTLAVGCVGFTSPGLNANVLDISPAFAGLVFSMSNTIATIPGIVSPTLTELILHPDGNAAAPASATSWRAVFYLAGGINVVAIVLYVIFAKAHPVPRLM